MSSGRREMLEDEKTVVAEIARLIHVVKTNEKQRKVIQRASKKSSSSTASRVAPSAKTESKRKTSKKRVSANSGSVWIQFTAGLQKPLPTGDDAATNAAFRLQCSQKKREAALVAAVAYYESALGQAREAGMASSRGIPVTAEGAQYLHEQYLVAKSMLNVGAVGLRRARCVTLLTGHEDVVSHQAESISDASYRACFEWASQQVVKERSLLKAPQPFVSEDEEADAPSSSHNAGEELSVEEEARQIAHEFRFVIADDEALQKASHCIVKVKGPAGKKTTSAVTTQKLANSMKTNLAQMLRKEMTPLLKKSADPAPQGGAAASSPARVASNAKLSASGSNNLPKGSQKAPAGGGKQQRKK